MWCHCPCPLQHGRELHCCKLGDDVIAFHWLGKPPTGYPLVVWLAVILNHYWASCVSKELLVTILLKLSKFYIVIDKYYKFIYCMWHRLVLRDHGSEAKVLCLGCWLWGNIYYGPHRSNKSWFQQLQVKMLFPDVTVLFSFLRALFTLVASLHFFSIQLSV